MIEQVLVTAALSVVGVIVAVSVSQLMHQLLLTINVVGVVISYGAAVWMAFVVVMCGVDWAAHMFAIDGDLAMIHVMIIVVVLLVRDHLIAYHRRGGGQ